MKRYCRFFMIVFLTVTFASPKSNARAGELPLSQRAANAAIERWPNGRFVPASQKWAWNYELGTLLEGMDSVWLNTADPRYFNYVKGAVDQFVDPDGSIPTRKLEEYQLDNILLGRQLLFALRCYPGTTLCQGCRVALPAAYAPATYSLRWLLA